MVLSKPSVAVVGACAGVAVTLTLTYALNAYGNSGRDLRGRNGKGKVYLIGAGPGDVELLTIRARRVLSAASVAVLDDLVSEEMYSLLPWNCEKIYVGKRGGKKDSTPQTTIDEILVKKCKQGHTVARVKGGDPLIFARVNSELQALQDSSCEYELVPGISSTLAAPAVAGIPLTHKELGRHVLLVSGHNPGQLDFDALARIDTLVILMATRTLKVICEELMVYGRSPSTPAALIHNATLPNQVILKGTLGDLYTRVGSRKFSPAIVVIGDVVQFADETRES